MSAVKMYPVLNLSETYIRQALYDMLPQNIREVMDFEEFRNVVTHDDYRYFASAMSDLLNDYITEHEILTDFISQAGTDTISQSENLSKLYVAQQNPDE